MSIRKRGPYYIVDVCNSGRRIRQSARSHAEARKLETELKRAIAVRRSPEKGLEAALKRYLDSEVPRLRDQRNAVSKSKYLRPFLAGKSFDDAGDVAEQLKLDLTAAGFSPATINRRLAILRRLCNLAFRRWGWIEQPVGQRVTLLTENNARHIYLTIEQVKKLAEQCSQGASDAIRLAAYTGLRRAELLGLSTENVSGNHLILGSNTKTGRPRLVPVPKDARDVLKRIPLRTTPQLLRNEWEAAREALGLGHVHFHDLRHTYASWLAQANVAMGTIGTLLGHTQASTTKRYAHLSPEALEEAVSRIGNGTKRGTRKRKAA